MNILKYLYPINSIKRKILFIKDDIFTLVSQKCSEKVFVDWFGVYNLDPKCLFFYVGVKTDETKIKLKNDLVLIGELRNLLEKYDYPKEARASIEIDIESQETVDRESNGNWFYHYK